MTRVVLPTWSMSNVLVDQTDSRGRLELYLPTPLLLVARCGGHFSEGLADEWVRVVRPVLRKTQGMTMFNEWREMTGYDSASRQKLTALTLGNKGAFKSIYFVTNSRIVAMGVNVASVPLAMMGVEFITCRTDEEFLRKLDASRLR